MPPRLHPLPPAVTSVPGLELDFDVDIQDPQYAVPCPVPWCDARKVGALLPLGRPNPCGVDGEPFVGLHIARIKFAHIGNAKQHARAVKRWQRAMGMSPEDAEGAVTSPRSIQAGMDYDLIPNPTRKSP